MSFENEMIFVAMIVPLFGLGFLVLTNKAGFEQYFSKKALAKLDANTGRFTTKMRNLFVIVGLVFLGFAMMKPAVNIASFGWIDLELFCLFISFVFVVLGFYSLRKFKI